MQRVLSVMSVRTGESEKWVTVQYLGKTHEIHMEVLEPMRSLGKWILSDSNLKSTFGIQLKPHYAALVAELARRYETAKDDMQALSVDLDRLDDAIARGESIREALQN